jgi:hypothetical protein
MPFTPFTKGGGKQGPSAKTAGKFTEKQDKAYDAKHGIKEGSKKDNALDRKRGLPIDKPGAGNASKARKKKY